MNCKTRIVLVFTFVLSLTSCTFNPFAADNQLTGSLTGTAVGAGAGVGIAWAAGATKTATVITGLGGAALGYYLSTLRFASSGVLHGGGQVFTMGQFITIDVPSNRLFDVNTAEFLDDACPILNSVVAILSRYPNQNIIISGNTGGFGTARWEHKLSEDRARQVASYLWAHGISEFKNQSIDRRKLTFVGYGNYFPIANNLHICSICQNSHIQITAYPTCAELEVQQQVYQFNNVGGLNEAACAKSEADYTHLDEYRGVINESQI